jgi:hypothetical protein
LLILAAALAEKYSFKDRDEKQPRLLTATDVLYFDIRPAGLTYSPKS